MAIKHGISLIITPNTLKEDLQEYLDAIPAGNPVRAEVNVQEADRPGETSKTTVMLLAEWSA